MEGVGTQIHHGNAFTHVAKIDILVHWFTCSLVHWSFLVADSVKCSCWCSRLLFARYARVPMNQ
jgi:hypothetical protein